MGWADVSEGFDQAIAEIGHARTDLSGRLEALDARLAAIARSTRGVKTTIVATAAGVALVIAAVLLLA